MADKKVFLYNHGGSANHGCEALVRTTCSLFEDKERLCLFSEAPQQDFHYGLYEIANIYPAVQAVSRFSFGFLNAYLHLKRTQDFFPMDVLPYRRSMKAFQKGDIEISVGGDVYCYEDYPKYIKLHELICRKGCKSVLLGCSLEEKLFDDPAFVRDMGQYSFISARETYTYRLLKQAGLKNIGYAPDTAFTLPSEELPLPCGFQDQNTIGINLSPLASEKESRPGLAFENYKVLIRSILDRTDCAVALIPHVVWKGNDDRVILKQLYDEYKESGRVVMIPDHTCMQLKGFISRCRFFVGARTHATIAAYSSYVPTLVLGYSIKSRGIAADLFGTDEHYVVPVQGLKKDTDLSDAFWWLWDREEQVRGQLRAVLPEYVSRIDRIKDDLQSVTGYEL